MKTLWLLILSFLALSLSAWAEPDPSVGGVADDLRDAVIRLSVKQQATIGSVTRSGIGAFVRADGTALVPGELFVFGVRTDAGTFEELYCRPDQVTVKVTLRSGEQLSAQLLGVDPRTRLASIRLASPPEDLKVIPTGRARPIVADLSAKVLLPGGETMEAVLPGSEAIGVDAHTNRFMPLVEVRLQRAAVGLSGAPVFDSKGQFVGLLRAQKSGTPGATGMEVPAQVWFALPPSLVERVADGLSKPPYVVRHRWVGIQCDNARVRPGAVIVGLTPGGPGQLAGLMIGDIIVGAGGLPVRSSADFAGVVFSQPLESWLPITVLRGGTTLQLRVKVAIEPASPR